MPNSIDSGQVGERIVVQWMRGQGWTILSERWRCRWGELDIVALSFDPPLLAFVEVKARKPQNWDLNGLMALTAQKQSKLIQSAQLYLAEFPNYGDYACRFDLALVQILPQHLAPDSTNASDLDLETVETPWVNFGRDRLRLRHYIQNVFDA